jgi:hypothetical protein
MNNGINFKTIKEFEDYVNHENKQFTYQGEIQHDMFSKQLILKKEYKDFDYIVTRNMISFEGKIFDNLSTDDTPKSLKSLTDNRLKMPLNTFWFCGYYVIKDFFNNSIQAKEWINENEQLVKDNLLVHGTVTYVNNDISNIYGDDSNNLLIGFDSNHAFDITSYEDYNKNEPYEPKQILHSYKDLSYMLNELTKLNHQIRKLKNTLPEFKNDYVKK